MKFTHVGVEPPVDTYPELQVQVHEPGMMFAHVAALSPPVLHGSDAQVACADAARGAPAMPMQSKTTIAAARGILSVQVT